MKVLRRLRPLALLAAASFLVAGCGKEPAVSTSPTVERTAVDPADLLRNAAVQLLQGDAGEWPWEGFVSGLGSLLTRKDYLLDVRVVSYPSLTASGSPATLTGLLILPRATNGSIPAVPLLLYQHATEVNPQLAPSRFPAHLDRPLDFPEAVLAASIASAGYAVAMADFEGLGVSRGPHPYLHRRTLARQTVDMLVQARQIMATSSGAAASPCTWNRQLFLMGYSEGGFATMAALRELQTNHAEEYRVTAAAALSAPHDLSGTMRGVMLDPAPYKAPYFIPFLLLGYQYAYQGLSLFSPEFALAAPFSSTIPPLFAGGTPRAATINEALGMSLEPLRLVAPRSILSAQFIEELSRETSTAVMILRENDTYRDWIPSAPLRIMHHPADELVPYANSVAAFNAFSTAGGKSMVSLVPEQAAVPLPDDPAATVHVSGALPELSEGFHWLDSFRNR